MKKFEIEAFETKLKYLPSVISDWALGGNQFDGLKVLDFGCGFGITALGIALNSPTATVVGIDVGDDFLSCLEIANAYLELTELPPNLSFEKVNAGSVGNRFAKFDLIYSWSTIEHVERRLLPLVLRELKSRLNQSGQMFIQIAPLYYSSEGSHAFQQVPVRWAHLLHDHETYCQLIRLASSSIEHASNVISTFYTLNKISSSELISELRANNFEITRIYETVEDYEVPCELLQLYDERDLRMSQIVIMAQGA